MQCACGNPNCKKEIHVSQNCILIADSHDTVLAYFDIQTGTRLIGQLQDAVNHLRRQAKSQDASKQ